MKKVLLVAFLIISTVVVSQKRKPTTDSLLSELSKSKSDTAKVNILNKLSVAFLHVDSTKGLDYARQALKIAQKNEWNSGIAQSYFHIATQYLANFSYKKALGFFEESLRLANDKRLQSKIYTGMGSCYIYESNYSKALASYHSALKIDESRGDKEGIAKSAMNIGSVYYSTRDYPKSIAFFNRSLAQKDSDPYFNAMLLRNIGAAYNTMGQVQKALTYFDRSLKLCEKIDNDSFKASLLSDIALAYYDMEDYGKAIYFSKSALQINVKFEDKVNIAFSFGIIGDSYIQKAKTSKSSRAMLDSAVYYLDKSIALHKELSSIRGIYDDYTSLTEAQKLQGDYQTAIDTYEKSIVYKDSIFNSDNRETIKNIEDKRAIELRDKELKISKLMLEANQRQKWALSLGIVFLGIIGGLLYYQNASRKETNRYLKSINADLDRANTMKTRLLSILNHDLRSPVNSFIHYIQFKRESPELLDEATKTRIEKATLDSAKNLLISMEDMLLWTKDQMDNFEPHPEKFQVRSIFEAIDKHFSAVGHTSLVFEFDDFEIFADENYLKTIVRNLTANAIDATRNVPARITWRAKCVDGTYILSITDNGPGLAASQLNVLFDDREVGSVKSGLGLHLVRDLAQAIAWNIVVDSNSDGTTFTLSNGNIPPS